MAGRRGGTERVLSKLKASIENENYYEAHQMYRTLYFRFSRLWFEVNLTISCQIFGPEKVWRVRNHAF